MLEKMASNYLEAIFVENPIGVGSLNPPPTAAKKKRNLPGNPDPSAEVISLSPKTLMATNRFLCEICGKGFQRDQNLQLHRRGHNLPWKLKQRSGMEVRKRVYVCPEKGCVHHHPSRALGDLTGIKKHFCRKHGDKKWKCDKCAKRYAVQSDWKAHSKTCGTREYRCDCGTLFSRRDNFITHRAFCDALAEETARVSAGNNNINYHFIGNSLNPSPTSSQPFSLWSSGSIFGDPNTVTSLPLTKEAVGCQLSVPSLYSTHETNQTSSASLSATALLQKAAQIGSTTDPYSSILGSVDSNKYCGLYVSGSVSMVPTGLVHVNIDSGLSELQVCRPAKRRNIINTDLQDSVGLGQTRDFLGVAGQQICHPSPINGWF